MTQTKTLVPIFNIKGGSGKTTLAFLLGWYLEHTLPGGAAWLDLDVGTASLTDIYNRRSHAGLERPPLAGSARFMEWQDPSAFAAGLTEALTKTERRVIVMDFPPSAPNQTLLQLLAAAPIIVVPTIMEEIHADKTAACVRSLRESYGELLETGRKRIVIVPMKKPPKGSPPGAASYRKSLTLLTQIADPPGISIAKGITSLTIVPSLLFHARYPSEALDMDFFKKPWRLRALEILHEEVKGVIRDIFTSGRKTQQSEQQAKEGQNKTPVTTDTTL